MQTVSLAIPKLAALAATFPPSAPAQVIDNAQSAQKTTIALTDWEEDRVPRRIPIVCREVLQPKIAHTEIVTHQPLLQTAV